jgi:hypothetical protein
MIPVFIGGTGRSGTTIMLELLGKHSKFYASNPPELTLLTESEGLLDSFEKNNIEKFNEKINNRWYVKDDEGVGLYHSINKQNIDNILQQFNENFYKDSKNTIKDFYINLFKNQDLFDNSKNYLGDSTPSNIRNADRINKIFPEAKFIHMFRDGRDVAYSMYMMREIFGLPGNKTEFDALDFWYDRTVQSFSSLNNLNPDQYISIRFEDLLINERYKTFFSILNFLKLEKEDEIIKYFNTNVRKEKTRTKSWMHLYTYKDFDKKYNEILLKLEEKNIYIEKRY